MTPKLNEPNDLDPYPYSPMNLYTYAMILSCGAPIFEGPVDNPSTHGIPMDFE